MKTYIKATTVPNKGNDLIDDYKTDNAHTWSSEKIEGELENTFQDHLIGYIRNKPIYRKVILDSTAYNVSAGDIALINLASSNKKFIRSGGYVKYKLSDTVYRSYTINSKTCAVEIFDQDETVYLESQSSVVGKNIDIYAWIDYMQV